MSLNVAYKRYQYGVGVEISLDGGQLSTETKQQIEQAFEFGIELERYINQLLPPRPSSKK